MVHVVGLLACFVMQAYYCWGCEASRGGICVVVVFVVDGVFYGYGLWFTWRRARGDRIAVGWWGFQALYAWEVRIIGRLCGEEGQVFI